MPHRRKGIIVILDGVGDRPQHVLGGKTPLEVARTPNFDLLCKRGMTGMMHPIRPGIPVGTHIGTGLLMGLAPSDIKRLRRGPVSAFGAGLNLNPGEVALRCNFATLQRRGDWFGIVDRRAGRISEHTDELADALSSIQLSTGLNAQIRSGTQHRAVLVFSGRNVSASVTDTDPGAGSDGRGVLRCRALNDADPGAELTAQSINLYLEEAYELLSSHPVNARRRAAGLPEANGLLTREAGSNRAVRNIIRHMGIDTATVAGEDTIVGLGRIFGFTNISHPEFTGLPGTNVALKVAMTLEALDDHNLVFLHIKGTDTASHDRKPQDKVAFLEQIDSAMGPLVARTDLVIGVTGDHSTDSYLGRHTGDPVPSIIYSPDVRRDMVDCYSESAVAVGMMGSISSTGFVWTLLDQMNVTHNFRESDTAFLPR